MDEIIVKMIVLFEDPFWIGLFEKVQDNEMSVCKVTFGAEPKDTEIFDFILNNYHKLHFSPSVDVELPNVVKNPKRMLRQVKKQVLLNGISSKAKQALKKEQEEKKITRKIISKEQKEAMKKRMFELRKQKQKEKHKGR